MMSYILSSPNTLEQVTYLLWAAHNLERAADRVTNISQRVVLTATGEVRELAVEEMSMAALN